MSYYESTQSSDTCVKFTLLPEEDADTDFDEACFSNQHEIDDLIWDTGLSEEIKELFGFKIKEKNLLDPICKLSNIFNTSKNQDKKL